MENFEGPPPEEWELTQRTFGGHYVLNWSNPFVQEEYHNAIDHWLEAGVDGFYMKHLENMHVIDTHDISSTLQQWRHTLDASSPTRKRVLIASSNFAEWLVHKLGLDGSKLECIDLLDHPLLVGSGEEMGHQVDGLRKAWPEGWPYPHVAPGQFGYISYCLEDRT
ncbi:uncharacterized protein CEXT_476491 [Caerostris extrusa]|uniref:Uncharacterized protein n=1 Tax=Caerostris extrusa TaxID=172846 RepID=A0AAV4VZQ5_CAEEX|nr:uncharacterized protein CEXT_476491 [Caerostris extrusa]